MVNISANMNRVRAARIALADREARRAVALSGFAALDDGSTFNVTVLDLSYHGCKIKTPLALLPRLKLKISVLKLGALDAEVCWYAGGHAGLRICENEPIRQQETPRKHQRNVVTARVSLRRAGRPHYQVRIFDLALTGCKVEFVELPQQGELLWAKFDRLEALEATVRWVEGPYGGIEFTRPIHPAVFEQLLNRLQG